MSFSRRVAIGKVLLWLIGAALAVAYCLAAWKIILEPGMPPRLPDDERFGGPARGGEVSP